MSTKLGFWKGFVAPLKTKEYWIGFVKSAAMPLVKGGAKESVNLIDDKIVEIADKIIDEIGSK